MNPTKKLSSCDQVKITARCSSEMRQKIHQLALSRGTSTSNLILQALFQAHPKQLGDLRN